MRLFLYILQAGMQSIPAAEKVKKRWFVGNIIIQPELEQYSSDQPGLDYLRMSDIL